MARKHVWDIKKGNTVHEFEYGSHFEGIALEDAREQDGGFACNVQEKSTGRIVEFFGCPQYSAYAPDIIIEE